MTLNQRISRAHCPRVLGLIGFCFLSRTPLLFIYVSLDRLLASYLFSLHSLLFIGKKKKKWIQAGECVPERGNCDELLALDFLGAYRIVFNVTSRIGLLYNFS